MKILIADDDPVSRKLLQGYLQRWGYEVTAAADGAEAWRLYQQGEFPIVISDWMMPGIDGVELVRRIRSSQGSGYPYTILVTARSQKEDVVEGMEAGADDFVAKPFDRDELRVRLREGERIVRLEQTLAEQNRALREAQAALNQNDRDLAERAAAAGSEIELHAAALAKRLDGLQSELQSCLGGPGMPAAAGEGHDLAEQGAVEQDPVEHNPTEQGADRSTWHHRREGWLRLIGDSKQELNALLAAARELQDLGRGE